MATVEITAEQKKTLLTLFELIKAEGEEAPAASASVNPEDPNWRPMLGRRCVIRTYSAGVHIGDVTWINRENAMECKLDNAYRLWKWEDGGLSLSAIANNGVVKARVNFTNEVMLTNAIEYIPINDVAFETLMPWVEDKELPTKK